jgi:hypothetical protein
MEMKMKMKMTEDDFVNKIDVLDELLNDSTIRFDPAKIWHLLAEIADRAPRDNEELPSAADGPESGEAGRKAASIPCGLCGGKGVFRGIDCPACQTRVIADPWDDSRGIEHHSKSDLSLCGSGDIEPTTPPPVGIDYAEMDRASPLARQA